MKNLNKRMAAREGFTLVELIVVIAILAILAGVAYPVYTGYIDKAEDAKDLQNLSAVLTAVSTACAADETVGSITEITVTFGDSAQITVKGSSATGGFDIYGGTAPVSTAAGYKATQTFATVTASSLSLKSDANASATWTSGTATWTLKEITKG